MGDGFARRITVQLEIEGEVDYGWEDGEELVEDD